MAKKGKGKSGKRSASLKNPKVFDALVRQGMSESKAAAISNAAAKGGKKKGKKKK